MTKKNTVKPADIVPHELGDAAPVNEALELKRRQLAALRGSSQPGAAEACERLEREIEGGGVNLCPHCGQKMDAAE